MERAWHQFAPAVPDQKIIDCAVAGFVANGLFIRRLDVVDVQQRAAAPLPQRQAPRIIAAIALGGGTCACSELRQTTYPKQRDTPARPGWIGTLTVSAVPNRPRLPASMQAPQLTQTDASPALTLAPHLALAAVDGVAGPVVLSLQLAQSPPLRCPALPLG